MMKKLNLSKLLFFVILMVCNQQIYSQVGINTNSPQSSAALDVDVSSLPANGKKGFLLPRVNLLNNTDVVTIASPAAGLVVYNLVDNSSGLTAVTKNTYYFWNGVMWVDLATVSTVKRELIPQVFSLTGTQNQPTKGVTPDITTGVVVNYQGSTIALNSDNNITLNPNNTFTVNKAGRFEVSGSINYNPALDGSETTDVEFTIQTSTDNGSTWTELAKNTGVWGNSTGGYSRTLIIAPIIVTFAQNALFRCMVKSNYGNQGSTGGTPRIYPGTGIPYSRALKLQYLN